MHIGIASPISVKTLKDYLQITDEKHLNLGLGGTSVNNIILGLLEQGHKISVYTLDWSVRRKSPVIIEGKNLKVFIGQFRRFKGLKRYAYLDFMKYESNQIKEFILQDNPDIVNAHWSYEYAIGAIKSGKPHLITFRDEARTIFNLMPNPYRRIRLKMDNWVRINGENFNVNSPYLKENLSEWNDNLPVIGNPYSPNIKLGKPKQLSDTIKIVSLLNGWSKIKNPQIAIKSFIILKKKNPQLNIEYHLYGPGYSKNDNGYKWVQNNNYVRNIFFHGEVHHSKLMEELQHFDILLHPAIEESFGNTLIEAMTQGLPVVAGENSGAVPWVLNYGKNGILVNVKNVDDIVRGIELLIHDSKKYEELSISGLTYVENTFSPKTIAKDYIELYKEILNGKD
jgi:glycosyltransferase involved in cell wall biosynthesis